MGTDLRAYDDVLARQQQDAEFRAQWERTVLARAVALRLLAYRTEHGLSQAQLAGRLGMKQPAIARLEAGEHNPSLETLARLAQALEMEFLIAVAPAGRQSAWVSPRAEQAASVEVVTTEAGSRVLVAAE